MQALSIESTAVAVVGYYHFPLGLKQLAACSSTKLKAIVVVQ